MSADSQTMSVQFIAVNNMSKVLNVIGSDLDKVIKKIETLNKIGSKMTSVGKSIVGGTVDRIDAAVRKYADFEKAQLRLQSVLLRSDGAIDKSFARIDKVSRKLGNLLPGSTADFYELAAGMHVTGVSAESLANGVLEAGAKLGYVLDLPYAQAGEHVANFQKSLGIADQDMSAFVDTVQRTANMGVDLEELETAFEGMSVPLQTLGIQGLDSANKLTPLVGMLIETSKSGDEVGSAMGDIFKIGQAEGLFSNIDEMLGYFEKLGKLDKTAKAAEIQKTFGQGSTANVAGALADKGTQGYQTFAARMAGMASMDQKIALYSGSVGANLEVMRESVDKVNIALGGVFGEDLKGYSENVRAFSEKVVDWVGANKPLVSILAKVALGTGVFMWVLGAAMNTIAFAIGGVVNLHTAFTRLRMAVARLRAMSFIVRLIGGVNRAFTVLKMSIYSMRIALMAFSRVFMLSMNTAKLAVIGTGIGALVVGLAMAAVLVYQNWDKIKVFFQNLWNAIKPGVEPVMKFFTSLFDKVAPIAKGIGKIFGFGNESEKPVTVQQGPHGFGGAGASGSWGAPALAGGPSLHYAPVVNIKGSVSSEDFKAELRRHKREIYEMMQSVQRQEARGQY